MGYRRGDEREEHEGQDDGDGRHDDSSHREGGGVRLGLVNVGHERLDVGLGAGESGLGLRTVRSSESTARAQRTANSPESLCATRRSPIPRLRPHLLATGRVFLRPAATPSHHPARAAAWPRTPPTPRAARGMRCCSWAHLGHKLLLKAVEALGHHGHVRAAHARHCTRQALYGGGGARGRQHRAWARGGGADTHFFLTDAMPFLL